MIFSSISTASTATPCCRMLPEVVPVPKPTVRADFGSSTRSSGRCASIFSPRPVPGRFPRRSGRRRKFRGITALDDTDGAGEPLGVIGEIEAVDVLVESLAVGEHQQVGQDADDHQRGPLPARSASDPHQEVHRNEQAEVDEDERRVPHADERDQHEAGQETAEDAARGIGEKDLAGLRPDATDVLRVNLQAQWGRGSP